MTDHSGMRLGRTAPTIAQRLRALPLVRYLPKVGLPEAPDEVHNAEGAPIAMLGNDVYGDCTFAALGNLRAIVSKLYGDGRSVPSDKIVAAYLKFTDGQDVGAVEQDVLSVAQKDGFDFGDADPWKLDAWAKVDLRDADLCRRAIHVFGALYLGVALPLSAQRQDVWDVGPRGTRGHGFRPGSWGGHALLWSGYARGVAGHLDLVTWGEVKPCTPGWLRAYGDEGYVALPRDLAIAAGIDHDKLIDDVNALRSQ